MGEVLMNGTKGGGRADLGRTVGSSEAATRGWGRGKVIRGVARSGSCCGLLVHDLGFTAGMARRRTCGSSSFSLGLKMPRSTPV